MADWFSNLTQPTPTSKTPQMRASTPLERGGDFIRSIYSNVAEQPLARIADALGLTNLKGMGSADPGPEVMGEGLDPPGAGQVAKAISWIPPKYTEDLAKRLITRLKAPKLKGDPNYVSQRDAIIPMIEADPHVSSVIGNVRPMDPAIDKARGLMRYAGFYDPRSRPVSQAARLKMRNDPATSSVIEAMIQNPLAFDPQMTSEIAIHKQIGKRADWKSPEELWKHETGHAAQDISGFLPESQANALINHTPYPIKAHEIGARIGEVKRRAQELGTPFNYYNELERELNALRGRQYNNKKIQEVTDYLNQRLRGRNRVITGGIGTFPYRVKEINPVPRTPRKSQIIDAQFSPVEPNLTEKDLDFNLPKLEGGMGEFDEIFSREVDDVTTTLKNGQYPSRELGERLDAEKPFYEGIGSDPANKYSITDKDFNIPDVEVVDPNSGIGLNASGESAASQEAINRKLSMQLRGERYAVKRGNQIVPLDDVSAQDWNPKYGGEFGIIDKDGNFRPH